MLHIQRRIGHFHMSFIILYKVIGIVTASSTTPYYLHYFMLISCWGVYFGPGTSLPPAHALIFISGRPGVLSTLSTRNEPRILSSFYIASGCPFVCGSLFCCHAFFRAIHYPPNTRVITVTEEACGTGRTDTNDHTSKMQLPSVRTHTCIQCAEVISFVLLLLLLTPPPLATHPGGNLSRSRHLKRILISTRSPGSVFPVNHWTRSGTAL